MVLAFGVVLILAAVLYGVGPRPDETMTARFDPAAIGQDIDRWLSEREAAFPDIRFGLGKEIVWADPLRKNRTPLSIVYVHGFSASKGEVRPLPDRIARDLGANLFYTRLAGHGRSDDAMVEATLDLWADDIAEALAIGERLGGRTVIIATSTGATLSSWAPLKTAAGARVAAVVFLSPNYRLASAAGFLLSVPYAGWIVRLVLGRYRAFTPANERQAALWTHRYPAQALLPMAALVRGVGRLPVEAIAVPALFVYGDEDTVVASAATARVLARWGARHDRLDPGPFDDPARHVVAGDALSPGTTEPLAERITAWFRQVLAAS